MSLKVRMPYEIFEGSLRNLKEARQLLLEPASEKDANAGTFQFKVSFGNCKSRW